jgi:hypothetical protein
MWAKGQEVKWSTGYVINWFGWVVKWSDEQFVKWSEEQVFKWSDEQVVKWSDEQVVKWSDEQVVKWLDDQVQIAKFRGSSSSGQEKRWSWNAASSSGGQVSGGQVSGGQVSGGQVSGGCQRVRCGPYEEWDNFSIRFLFRTLAGYGEGNADCRELNWEIRRFQRRELLMSAVNN